MHNHRDPINGVTLTLKGQPKKKTKRKKTTSYSISFRVQDTCEKEKNAPDSTTVLRHSTANTHSNERYRSFRILRLEFSTRRPVCVRCVGRARNSVPVPLLTQKYELIIIKWVFFFVSPIPFVQCILFEKSFRSWLYMLTHHTWKSSPRVLINTNWFIAKYTRFCGSASKSVCFLFICRVIDGISNKWLVCSVFHLPKSVQRDRFSRYSEDNRFVVELVFFLLRRLRLCQTGIGVSWQRQTSRTWKFFNFYNWDYNLCRKHHSTHTHRSPWIKRTVDAKMYPANARHPPAAVSFFFLFSFYSHASNKIRIYQQIIQFSDKLIY